MAPMKRPAQEESRDLFEVSHSLTHVAHRWHCNRRDVRALLQQGELDFVDVEGQLRVPDDVLCRFEREHLILPQPHGRVKARHSGE